jgi:Bacterial regulatory proteins, luxR family
LTAFVAEGFTNREVAERVLVSRPIVDFHLRSIFRKLDIRSRVELARIALEQENANVERDRTCDAMAGCERDGPPNNRCANALEERRHG